MSKCKFHNQVFIIFKIKKYILDFLKMSKIKVKTSFFITFVFIKYKNTIKSNT